jgi:hypothetical protein
MLGMSIERVSAPVGKTTYTENGASVFVLTSLHEALHIITAENNGTSVESATIVKSGNALGSTQLSRPDAASAMAAHAHGHSGTSWDVYITTRMGVNTQTASSTAVAIVNENYHQLNPVAVALEENRTMSGTEIRSVIREADEDKKYGPKIKVDVYIKNQEGLELKFKQESRGHENIIVEFQTSEMN